MQSSRGHGTCIEDQLPAYKCFRNSNVADLFRMSKQVKGVGTLIAPDFLLTLEDPHRFRKSRDVSCYLGLQPDGETPARANRRCTSPRKAIRICERYWCKEHSTFCDRLARTAICDARPEAGRAWRKERQEASHHCRANGRPRWRFATPSPAGTRWCAIQPLLETVARNIVRSEDRNISSAGHFDVGANMGDWINTLVVTRDFVHVLTPDGKIVCQAPYEPRYPSYDSIEVYFLEPTNQFAFWFSPSYATNSLMHWKLPTHIVWTDGNSKITKSLDLPSDERTWKESWVERLPESVMPPVAFFITSLLNQGDVLAEWKYYLKHYLVNILIPFSGAVVCVGVGWWLGRRYHFTTQSQLKWALFHLCFNLPGLLAFLCVQEWPAREVCPNCKKLRLVDREKCEYCEAEFAPPAKNGTEIFEMAGK